MEEYQKILNKYQIKTLDEYNSLKNKSSDDTLEKYVSFIQYNGAGHIADVYTYEEGIDYAKSVIDTNYIYILPFKQSVEFVKAYPEKKWFCVYEIDYPDAYKYLMENNTLNEREYQKILDKYELNSMERFEKLKQSTDPMDKYLASVMKVEGNIIDIYELKDSRTIRYIKEEMNSGEFWVLPLRQAVDFRNALPIIKEFSVSKENGEPEVYNFLKEKGAL